MLVLQLLNSYGILKMSLIVTLIYIASIVVALVLASRVLKVEREKKMAIREASKLLKEIKQTIIRRNNKMEIGTLTIRTGDTMEDPEATQRREELTNRLTLTDLVTQEPLEEQYEEVVDILARIARQTYQDYKFLIVKAGEDIDEANFMQIVSSSMEMPDEHKEVFSKSIKYGLEMQVVHELFAERVREGKVIQLGSEAVIIVEDGTNQAATGVSPINSGLDGGEIAFNISFVLKKDYDTWYGKAFPKKEEGV